MDINPTQNSAASGAQNAQTDEKLETKKKQLHKAAQQFEGFFLQMIWKSMRKTIPQSAKSSEAGLYTDMLDETFADNMSRTNRFGLGEMLYKSLEPALEGVKRQAPIIKAAEKSSIDKKV